MHEQQTFQIDFFFQKKSNKVTRNDVIIEKMKVGGILLFSDVPQSTV